jgi:hypothetical protein
MRTKKMTGKKKRPPHLNPRNPRQLRLMQRPTARNHKLRPQGITPIRRTDPAACGLVPFDFGAFGLEQGAPVEIKHGAHAVAMFEDFGGSEGDVGVSLVVLENRGRVPTWCIFPVKDIV